jgi:hypothetical protein
MSANTADDDDPRSELAQFVQAGLGHSVDGQVIDQLAEMQAKLQSQQQELARLLAMKKISRDKYIGQLDAVMQDAARKGRRALGSDDFHKMFGEFRVHNIVDVSAFVAGHTVRG